MRVEEAAMHSARSGAGTTMQEQHRAAVRIAGLLPVHDVPTGQRQEAGLIGADLGKQVAAGHDTAML
jgi:hypothetical protein